VLIVLWVRSYWCNEGVTYIDSPSSFSIFGSAHGTLFFDYKKGTPERMETGLSFHRNSQKRRYTGFAWDWYKYDPALPRNQMRMNAADNSIIERRISLYVPYWFLVLLFGIPIAAVAFSRPYRFSLRTLLVATTLIAVALAVIVRAMR
jgi:hypothetical protein